MREDVFVALKRACEIYVESEKNIREKITEFFKWLNENRKLSCEKCLYDVLTESRIDRAKNASIIDSYFLDWKDGQYCIYRCVDIQDVNCVYEAQYHNYVYNTTEFDKLSTPALVAVLEALKETYDLKDIGKAIENEVTKNKEKWVEIRDKLWDESGVREEADKEKVRKEIFQLLLDLEMSYYKKEERLREGLLKLLSMLNNYIQVRPHSTISCIIWEKIHEIRPNKQISHQFKFALTPNGFKIQFYNSETNDTIEELDIGRLDIYKIADIIIDFWCAIDRLCTAMIIKASLFKNYVNALERVMQKLVIF